MAAYYDLDLRITAERELTEEELGHLAAVLEYGSVIDALQVAAPVTKVYCDPQSIEHDSTTD